MLHLVVLVVLVPQIFAFRLEASTECSVPISNDSSLPLILTGSSDKFLYPEYHVKDVTVGQGEDVDFACPGSTINGLKQAPSSIASTVCDDGKFIYNDKSVKPEAFTCGEEPIHVARFTDNVCESNGKEAEIGYPLDDGFIRLIKICFDDVSQTTLYSHYNLTRSISSRSHDVARIYFIQDKGIYNFKPSVNSLYVRGGQRKTINSILGLPEDSTQYIQDGKEFFLARGHLTAKADFIYASQQRATFHYINVAPQWQTFNEANWLAVENGARYIADSRNLDLQVYTGTYGVATLPHASTGGQRKLYLYVDGSTKGLPVPKLYWKVLYDSKNKAGIALIGVNNPYLKKVGTKVCKDISSQIDWLAWQPNNATAGFSYACSVDDLRKTVTYIPELDIQTLLV